MSKIKMVSISKEAYDSLFAYKSIAERMVAILRNCHHVTHNYIKSQKYCGICEVLTAYDRMLAEKP